MSQPDAREGQAGPFGESERPIVPSRPGNAGGGKGPHFGYAVEVTKSRGIGRKVLQPRLTVRRSQKQLSTLVKALSPDGTVGQLEKPVGEPGAANPHARFDEREVETGHGRILWHRQPKGPVTRMAALHHRATSRLYHTGPLTG